MTTHLDLARKLAKELVRRFRENERVHTEEWDETRYLEQKVAQALLDRDKYWLSQMEPMVEALRPFANEYERLSECIRIATEERPEITANEVMNLENSRARFFQAHQALAHYEHLKRKANGL